MAVDSEERGAEQTEVRVNPELAAIAAEKELDRIAAELKAADTSEGNTVDEKLSDPEHLKALGFDQLKSAVKKVLSGEDNWQGLLLSQTLRPEFMEDQYAKERRDPTYRPVRPKLTNEGGLSPITAIDRVYSALGAEQPVRPDEKARMAARRESQAESPLIQISTETDSGVTITETWSIGESEKLDASVYGIQYGMKNIHGAPVEGELHTVEFRRSRD